MNYATNFSECLQRQIGKDSLSNWGGGSQYKVTSGRTGMTVTQNILFSLSNKRPIREMEANSEIIVKLIIDLYEHSSLELTPRLLGNLGQVSNMVLGDYVFVLYLEGRYRSSHQYQAQASLIVVKKKAGIY
jgi:hypothetical protein